ncbi:PhnD/SsuA/transferrin family substrate-binding protein [Natronogracilivirga saccharolytica]|uniref:PhnD/SsuA/transferrin family substrate-binding protein n=1 Tax=Natronogracilivirga saccharolytica TaxID=2812953 RepID=A0A8J7RGA5_9BACT|nr:PhnD/SsuA/transferrin family substrate-binding protein [Natronogracilivirga saccharolytica]MBP3191350.1 PhnD/SsuA/transferrin family substrate-binding protein [Natronogracilivirga saccharolytica]
MIRKKILVISLVIFLFAVVFTLFLHRSIVDITSPYPGEVETVEVLHRSPADTVHFGVISRFPANILYQGYQPVMDYLGRESDYHFELVISRSYIETVQGLGSGELDAAFLGSYIYTKSRDEYNIIPILKPLNKNGEPFFHSVVIVREDSDKHGLPHLKGHSLALPSAQSYSGNWLFRSGFDQYNMTRDDLSAIEYFDHHHSVVYEVIRGSFDAGSVKDRVAREFEGRGIRVIDQSPPVPGSPIVVPEDYDEYKVEAISSALLNIDPDHPDFQELISRWDKEFAFGFTRAEPRDYDHLLPQINQPERQP